jgi:hypothetical protein
MGEKRMENKNQTTTTTDDKEERALTLMLQGRKDTEVAEELGISRMTIYRWKRYDGRFLKELEDRRALLREQAEDNLLELSESAIETIKDALKDNDMKIRLQAAKLVLGMLKVGKGKEKDNSPILELLSEAIEGIKDEVGLTEKIT